MRFLQLGIPQRWRIVRDPRGLDFSAVAACLKIETLGAGGEAWALEQNEPGTVEKSAPSGFGAIARIKGDRICR
jgi:hypothetical protein